MKSKGLDVTRKEYFKTLKGSMAFILKVAQFYKVGLAHITFKNVQKFCEEELGIIYCGRDFPNSLHMFGGMTIKNKNGIIVGYNTKLCTQRCNFSIMHETYHALHHMDKGRAITQYSDILERDFYTKEELYREVEADIGSSIFLLNDVALIFQILHNQNYQSIIKKFGISKLALKLRVINFLYFNCSISYNASNLYAQRFIEGNNYPLNNCVNRYLKYLKRRNINIKKYAFYIKDELIFN